ncbi:hypothetical protein BH09BAC5_BH09BAC5_23610 [soil metagenome]
MKIKILFLLVLIIYINQNVIGQTAGFLFSSIKRDITNQKDSTLLIESEQKMWEAAKSGKVTMYDNPMFDCAFKVRMSKMAIQGCFKDSIPLKSGSSAYLINLMENRNADTCYIMSISPFLNYKYQDNFWVQDSIQPKQSVTKMQDYSSSFFIPNGHLESGPWKSGFAVRFLMPLSEYSNVLSEKDMHEQNRIVKNCFAGILGGNLVSDTLYRTVYFTSDSNEYLPQAPYANFLSYLKKGMLSGNFHTYQDPLLSKPMSKAMIEKACVAWDSTNKAEDPNNLGTFIYAPIKFEGQVKTLLVYEKWNYFLPPVITSENDYSPKKYLGSARQISAYGLLLTGGNVVWFSSDEVDKVILKENYNFTPYEECFRAERFKTLQIQVH